jgi:hypothetical protein
MTYEETAAALGISCDSVRDREDGVILKMKKEFVEFETLSPYKDFHKNNIMIWSFMGCRHNPTAEFVHPLYRIKTINGAETRQFVSRGDLFAERLIEMLGLNRPEIVQDRQLEPTRQADINEIVKNGYPYFAIPEQSPE